ncbi:MAG TPA: alpha/beta fold hydrolase [Actinomycetota bacterium]|jgi:medium-chain acyl-[acyl-carrier-protein] hydrolase
MEPDPWFPFRRHAGTARLRLFCFPFAGGGASTFRAWPTLVPNQVEVCAVQLPGRETRLFEARFTSLGDAVGPVVEAMRPYLDVPCALFGHSLGAALAYEVAVALSEVSPPAPVHLFVSGRGGPSLGAETAHTFSLPEEDFVRHVKAYGGMSDAVLANAELRAVFLPLLRDDIRLIDTYVPTGDCVLACPITAFAGSGDPCVGPDALEAWGRNTDAPFRVKLVAGGHFYLRDHGAVLVDEMVRDLRLSAPV